MSSHIPRLAFLHLDISSIDTPSSSHSTLDSFSLSGLQTFRKASIAKRVDPLKTICKFENAGGVCRDASCQDIHFSRLDDPKIQDRQSMEPDGVFHCLSTILQFHCSFLQPLSRLFQIMIQPTSSSRYSPASGLRLWNPAMLRLPTRLLMH
jgi:hypothetical protein